MDCKLVQWLRECSDFTWVDCNVNSTSVGSHVNLEITVRILKNVRIALNFIKFHHIIHLLLIVKHRDCVICLCYYMVLSWINNINDYHDFALIPVAVFELWLMHFNHLSFLPRKHSFLRNIVAWW
jgi:hypothetical protein